MEWLVIADDLTGACDTGGVFTRAWQTVKVVLDPNQGFPEADVLVLNSESRSMEEKDAAAAVASLLRTVDTRQGCRVYKKIDSTLRGHPWAELEVVMRELHLDQALVAPAFPEQGRTVVRGVVKVNGVPLRNTVFAQQISGSVENYDTLFPQLQLIPIGEVRKGEAWMKRKIAETGKGVLFVDAETSADLRILARSFLHRQMRLACGSAGLARSLAAEVGKAQPARSIPKACGPVMVISGSCHPSTQKQIELAARAGIQAFQPDSDELRVAIKRDHLVRRIAQVLLQSQPAIITASALPYENGQEQQMAAKLAQLALSVLEIVPAGGLVLTGGDTATAVCRVLGCGVINLGGEILPGIPWGRLEGGKYPGLRVVTKAGGFGDERALLTVLNWLAGIK